MRDTDGREARPVLCPAQLDAGTNLYATLPGPLRTAAVAERFERARWTCRSSSWHGFEVATGWCEAGLDPLEPSGTLLHGIVVPGELDTLASLLTEFGLSSVLELYDEEGTLLRELRSG